MKCTVFFLAVLACVSLLAAASAPATTGDGNMEYRPKGAGPVLFDHDYHVKLKGQHCDNCHFKTFQMTGGAEYQMDMSSLTKGKFCGSCHDGKKAFDVKDANSCKRCHRD